MTTLTPPPPDSTRLPAEPNPLRAPDIAQGLGLTTAKPCGVESGRIDVVRAVAGLRHMDPSAEPAMVFSHLAAVCVPAVCDEVVIDLVENGGRGYRIRRPAAEWAAIRGGTQVAADPLVPVAMTSDSVTVAVATAPGLTEDSSFGGLVACIWTDGYAPTPTDASLVQLMVDHAVALVQREQSTRTAHRLNGGAQKLHGALSRHRRIASAVGVVMALHHVDQAQAMDLLIRISDRTHVDLQDLADTVVSTGSLPASRRSVTPG